MKFGTGFLEVKNLGKTTGLTVSNDASLVSGESLIGGEVLTSGNNAVLITGPGLSWQSGAILLGDFYDTGPGGGTGTLSVASGAHVSASGNVDIGYSPDGGGAFTDTVTVSGSGSQLTTTGNLRVGFYGTGDLIISNGATVSDAEGDVAYSSTNATAASVQFSGATTPTNSVGSVIVTGTGSLWQNTTLIVGDNTTSPGNGYGTGTSTGTLTISDGGEVTSTNAIMVAANHGATGIINIGAAIGQTAVAPGFISAPAIIFGAGTGELVFNHTSTDYVFGIPIEGAGSVDVEAGTTVLTATNTYTGTTTINGGTLDVEGSITSSSAVAVNSGSTLTGGGTVDPATVMINSGATFAPGTPGMPGTSMTIAGNLAFQSGALYLVQVNATSTTFANITGTAALAGNVLAAISSTGVLQHQYTILELAGLNGTTFAGLTTTGLPPGFTASLTYSADDVFLDFNTGFAQQPGLNVNERNVANAIENFFNTGGSLPPGFVSILGLSGAGLANTLTQLDGEAATDAEKGAFQFMNDFLNLMLDPLADGHGGFGGGPATGFAPEQQSHLPPDIALAYAEALKAPAPSTFDRRWTAWGSAFGGASRTAGDPTIGSNTVTAGDYGFASGMDYHFSPDTLAGFAIAGGGTNWDLTQGLGSGRSDAVQAGLYAKSFYGPAYVAGSLAFANHWFMTDRIALGDQLAAQFTGQSYGARAEAGYRYGMPVDGSIVGVTPYAALQTQLLHTTSYSETDLTAGGFGLTYGAMNATDTRSELGARFDSLTLLGNALPLVLRGRLAWAHDWVSNPSLDAAFESLPGASFVVNGAAPPKNSALTSAGAELHVTPALSLLGKFDGEFGGGSQIYGGTGGVRYVW